MIPSNIMRFAEMQAMAAAVLLFVFVPTLAFFKLAVLWKIITLNLFTTLGYVALTTAICRKFAAGGKLSDSDRRDLTGKIVVLTGAAAPGIGFETCIEMAKMGATIFIGVRGADRAKKTATEIGTGAGVASSKIIGFSLDLSSLKSVKEFATLVLHQTDRIDYLINNAGVMMCPYELTVDGFEMQIGTNAYGHFYLTKLLLPTLLKSKARVVEVSSNGHFLMLTKEGIDYSKLGKQETYSKSEAYGYSKLANVYHVAELQRRYGDQGLKAYSLHPGAVDTALQRHVQFYQRLGKPLSMLTFKAPNQGCQTTLFCALSDHAVPGAFHTDCAFWESPLMNSAKAERWWEFCEETLKPKIAAL